MSKKQDYVLEQERLPEGSNTCCEGGNFGELHDCRKQQGQLVPTSAQVPAVQPTLIDVFSALARDTTIEVSRLRELMELQERAEARNAEREFIAALNRLQPRLPRITKDGSIDLGKGKPLTFARYETIDAAIRPLLTQEGFTISFGTAPHDKGITITATLSHAAGHSRTESMPLPFDTSGAKNAIQAVGSTISYGRRYLTCMLLNLITVGEDTDGVGLAFLDEQQVNNIIDLQSACDMDSAARSKFLVFMATESISEIHKRDYSKAVTALQAKLRKKQEAL